MAEQANAIGIPIIQKEVSPDMELYEKEFKEAVLSIKGNEIQSMVFGDIFLLEQINWVERVSDELGINPVEPLWDKQPLDIVEEFLSLGFKTIIVSCKADIMGKEYIGKSLSMEMARELQSRNICPCGENGEFHTFVVDGPLFKKRIEITNSLPVLKKGFWEHWFLDIMEYQVIDK